MRERRETAATLALCLGASQAGLLVLSPILAAVAETFDASTASAGQLRTISGLTAGVAALASGLVAARVGLRELLLAGLGLVAVGAALSAAAPSFLVMALAQVPVGAGVGLTYSAAVAAVAAWSEPGDRSHVLSLALLGPPLAWVVGMPVAGAVGDVSWRLSWVVVPLVLAVAGLGALARRPPTRPAAVRAGVRSVLSHRGVLRWSLGELLASSAWMGVLLFSGALFIESYDASVGTAGLLLGAAAAVYVPGNLLFRRWVDEHTVMLLGALAVALAALTAVFGAIRPNVSVSFAVFAALAFLAGGRTLAGNARGLDLAPDVRLGVTGLRTAALQFGAFAGALVGGVALALGGFTALGIALAVLFAAAALPYVWPGSTTLTP